jgi:hypothetical protein
LRCLEPERWESPFVFDRVKKLAARASETPRPRRTGESPFLFDRVKKLAARASETPRPRRTGAAAIIVECPPSFGQLPLAAEFYAVFCSTICGAFPGHTAVCFPFFLAMPYGESRGHARWPDGGKGAPATPRLRATRRRGLRRNRRFRRTISPRTVAGQRPTQCFSSMGTEPALRHDGLTDILNPLTKRGNAKGRVSTCAVTRRRFSAKEPLSPRARDGQILPDVQNGARIRYKGRKRHAICSRRDGPSCTWTAGRRRLSRHSSSL